MLGGHRMWTAILLAVRARVAYAGVCTGWVWRTVVLHGEVEFRHSSESGWRHSVITSRRHSRMAGCIRDRRRAGRSPSNSQGRPSAIPPVRSSSTASPMSQGPNASGTTIASMCPRTARTVADCGEFFTRSGPCPSAARWRPNPAPGCSERCWTMSGCLGLAGEVIPLSEQPPFVPPRHGRCGPRT